MHPKNPSGENNTATQQKQVISQLAQNGDIISARQHCSALCEQTPDDPEVWFLLGAINGAIPDYPEAERCCRKAITLAPGHPMLRYNLAIALLKQEKTSEAIEQFEQAIAIQPDFADAYRELGNAQTIHNEPLRAISSYEESTRLEPGSAITRLNLGSAHLKLGRMIDAAECFRQAIALQPDLIEAYPELAAILIQQYKFDKAIELLEQAIKKWPDSSLFFPLLATAYQEHGEAAIALRYYNKALSIDPGNVNANVGVAGIMALQGKYAEAGELLEPLLANNPENAAAKTTYTTFARYFGKADKAIEIAECEIKNDQITARAKSKYHFLLAQLYEKKGQLDIAFEHYSNGNRLRGAQFNYASYEKMFSVILEQYSSDAMSRLPRSDNASDSVIFIVGMPRSGTSLAEHILSSHPNVFGAGELRNINQIVDTLPKTLHSSSPYPFCLEQLTTEVLNTLSEQYLTNLNERSEGNSRYFTDKMPINFIHLGLISLLFPNAKLIHCNRDPKDTCLSCFFKLFSGELPYTYSLTDLGKFYRLYQRLMNHWKHVLPTPIYDLNYENLVSNQEIETRKLLTFCGLNWDDACLDFYKTDRTVATASHDQVRQPMYTNSIGRWRAYEKHLKPLFTALHPET